MSEALYDQPRFQSACDNILRPGGLALTGKILAAAKISPGAKILDIGCGLGATVAYLNTLGHIAAGADSSAGNISKAAKLHPGLDFRCGGAEALPAKDGEFSCVICECVLSLLSDPAKSLGEIVRVLAPGGKLLVSDFFPRDDPPAGLKALIAKFNFELIISGDAAQELRDLTARLVWEYGSLDALYKEANIPAKASYSWGVYLKAGCIL